MVGESAFNLGDVVDLGCVSSGTHGQGQSSIEKFLRPCPCAFLVPVA